MEERSLYRIKRGSFTRRDGPPVPIRDGKGNITGEEKQHILYSAKTLARMDARNEVYMTDEEADRFGRHKLERLIKSDIKTKPAPEEAVDGETVIAALIAEGEEATTKKEIRDWRKKVIDADLIDEVPTSKAAILKLLREVE